MYTVPTVHLSIEHMKHEILMQIGKHDQEMQEAVKAAVEEAVTSFDFRGEVSRAARAAIQESVRREVERFFINGPGSMAIRHAIEKTLDDQGSWNV